MSLSIGQVLTGRNASYRVVQVLKEAVTYKAVVEAAPRPTFVVLKVRPQGEYARMYSRERWCYEVSEIRDTPYIRKRLDLIGHDDDLVSNDDVDDEHTQCMVFEWMDATLWDLTSEHYRFDSQLPRVVTKSVLQALATTADLDAIHTDVNPNNVLVSDADGDEPVVKLGDLGCCIPAEGEMKERYQGIHIRAPEVWRGVGIFPATDIWSLGVTLAHWLAYKTIFGAADKIVKDLTNEWCIAKIIRLVGSIDPPVSARLREEFKMASYLESSTFVRKETGEKERFIKTGRIEDELRKLRGSNGQMLEAGCVEFVKSLLVLDHTKRPTAREALRHPWIRRRDDEVD